jgi:hypothetical protein
MFMIRALSAFILCSIPAIAQTASRVQVRLDTDEPEAVLSILAKRQAGTAVTDSDWKKLFDTEGYRRLKKRELAMKNQFEDADFQKFVMSQELLGRATALRQILNKWMQADMTRPGTLALEYLPQDATIKATIYPSIKPRDNSFVAEVDTDPAIFLYLDPAVTREQFENTMAHELHHIGYGTACPAAKLKQWLAEQSPAVQQFSNWAGAFGEGYAMLAAAGGPDIHPKATEPLEKRQRWDRDLANFNKDQHELDEFFRGILSGELTHDQARERGYSYFGYQGPWYTVGWRMAVTIERKFGRDRLVQAECDGSALAVYNSAVAKNKSSDQNLPIWSPEVIRALPVHNQ